MSSNQNYQIVTHRVGQKTAEIWVGNLQDDLKLALPVKVKIQLNNELAFEKIISSWLPAFIKSSKGYYCLVHVENLQPYEKYTVEIFVNDTVVASSNFKTLPSALPSENEKGFTIALSSCFSNQDDDGKFAKAFSDLSNDSEKSPDITFMVGDQVYLDLGFQSLLPIPAYMRKRMRDRYRQNWKDLSPVFQKSAVWMLPDDHEFWNDYPFNDLPILALQTLKLPYFRQAWVESANHAVEHIQQSKMLEIIDIGDDLSICLVDARRERHDLGFMSEASFEALLSWVGSSKKLGVIVIQQLLLDEVIPGERNIPSFKQQYARLVQAIVAADRHILVLTGDVHFGRVASVDLPSGKRLVEVAASPVANLKGFFNGLGAGVAVAKPEQFPPIKVDGIASVPVHYDPALFVPSIKGCSFSVYPKDRSKEHFCTLQCNKLADGSLKLRVNSWLIRERGGYGELISGFSHPFEVIFG